jgi:hypothetical protein
MPSLNFSALAEREPAKTFPRETAGVFPGFAPSINLFSPTRHLG